MFTSLRSRLWLSYAFVITIALMIVAIVLFVFILRNPFATREVQQRLKTAQSAIIPTPQKFIDNPDSLQELTQTYNVRTLVFDSARQLVYDSSPGAPPLPFPRRNPLNRNLQNSRDSNGEIWLYATEYLSNDRILVIAAPRPRVPVLNIFRDELLLPMLQGGVIALLLSLVLAFALSRWVADPLQQVVVAARNYPERALGLKPVSPRGPHEVQDLARAFNSMVARVESSQRSQRDFVANVSHELKTPLTSIRMFSELLAEGRVNDPAKQRSYLHIITAETARLTRLINNVLDFSRLERGEKKYNFRDCDLVSVARDTAETYRPHLENNGFKFDCSIPEHPLPVRGDTDALAQIIVNLLSNAEKYSNGPKEIELLVSRQDGPLPYAEVKVLDRGPGVPHGSEEKIFEKFYRAHDSLSSGIQGSGLGLTLARQIARAHGGDVVYESREGGGSCFALRLPLIPQTT